MCQGAVDDDAAHEDLGAVGRQVHVQVRRELVHIDIGAELLGNVAQIDALIVLAGCSRVVGKRAAVEVQRTRRLQAGDGAGAVGRAAQQAGIVRERAAVDVDRRGVARIRLIHQEDRTAALDGVVRKRRILDVDRVRTAAVHMDQPGLIVRERAVLQVQNAAAALTVHGENGSAAGLAVAGAVGLAVRDRHVLDVDRICLACTAERPHEDLRGTTHVAHDRTGLNVQRAAFIHTDKGAR